MRFRVKGLGCRVWVLGFRACLSKGSKNQDLGSRFKGLGFRI
jgi:hypothetical protein